MICLRNISVDTLHKEDTNDDDDDDDDDNNNNSNNNVITPSSPPSGQYRHEELAIKCGLLKGKANNLSLI
jgi:hypothetical protein